VRLDDYSNPVTLSEAVIINYADKRVLHDRIVSLNERMRYIEKRYGTEPEHKYRIQLLWEKTTAIEKQVFEHLHFGHHQLESHLLLPDLVGEMAVYQRICPQFLSGNR
jgi:hypothetical protein